MPLPRLIPSVFLAHGSPMLALNGGGWGTAVGKLGAEWQGLRGVLVCSAHWEAPGPIRISAAGKPGILHDFGGFPEALYHLDYPAPGSPALAREAQELLQAAGLEAVLDFTHSLDHGAWVPLRYLAPRAEVPVVQISLPSSRTPQQLLATGRALGALRESGVLILGSGGIVHNLRRLDWEDIREPEPWAAAFAQWIHERLLTGDQAALLDWQQAPGAAESVPTSEHLDPLFVALGAATQLPALVYLGWQLGNLSLASYRFG